MLILLKRTSLGVFSKSLVPQYVDTFKRNKSRIVQKGLADPATDEMGGISETSNNSMIFLVKFRIVERHLKQTEAVYFTTVKLIMTGMMCTRELTTRKQH